jgi:LPS-assembly protein
MTKTKANKYVKIYGWLFVLALFIGFGFAPVYADGFVDEPSAMNDENIALEADSLIYDREKKTVIASGNVRVEHQGYVLLADEVILAQETNDVDASGNVQISSPDGTVLLADHAQLTQTLKQGFIENIRVILSDGSRMAAESARLLENDRAELNRVTFTPCHICEEKKNAPVWQLRAVKVLHDKNKKRIYYDNAILEVLGVPILYLPYISHPDPSMTSRASGFLVPQIGGKKELGASIATPYYYVINESSDVTLTPIFYSRERPLLDMEFRQKLSAGEVKFSGQATYTNERDDFNVKTGNEVFRGAIFTDAHFNHSENWVSSLNTAWASDDTFLRRYGFSELDSLTNSVKTEAFFGQSYLKIEALSFQGLHVEDKQGQTPIIFPMIDYSFIGKPGTWGGIFKADASALILSRNQGMDTKRISASGSWERPFITEFGAQFLLNANVRGDIYSVDDAELADNPAFAGENGTSSRFLPQVSLRLNWPFIQSGSKHQQIIEPIIDIIGAPYKEPSDAIPLEDSRTFELSDSNIYSDNRFPGIDRYEGGTRVNYGVRWTVERGKFSSEVFIAQSYRLSNEASFFGAGSGLEGKFSDIVGRIEANINNTARIIYRFRMDKDNAAFRRNEIDAVYSNGNNSFSVGYFQLNRGPDFIGLADREEIRVAGAYEVKDNWTVYGDAIRNLSNGDDPIAHQLGLRYRDECLEFSLAWRKSYTTDRDIIAGSSIMFRIRLKHLG